MCGSGAVQMCFLVCVPFDCDTTKDMLVPFIAHTWQAMVVIMFAPVAHTLIIRLASLRPTAKTSSVPLKALNLVSVSWLN